MVSYTCLGAQNLITNLSRYDPYQKFAPQDCIGSLNAIVDKIDQVLAHGNASQIIHLKSLFGLEALKDNRDFAATIAFPLGGPTFYPTNTWQELNWDPAQGSSDVFLFCNNITNADSPHNITQLDYALAPYTNGEPWTNLGNYATYIKNYIVPMCPDASLIDTTTPGCFSTQNQTYWSDIANTNDRAYIYSTCTEAGIYQSARLYGPTLLSRVVQRDYTQQWCTWSFPPGQHNSIPSTPDLDQINKYGGYSVIADRLAHIDGDQDVWLDLCYHSTYAPPRRTLSSKDAYVQRPEMLITGAGHHWDSYGIKDVGAEPQFIREAHRWEVRIVKEWLRMWDEKKGKGNGTSEYPS